MGTATIASSDTGGPGRQQAWLGVALVLSVLASCFGIVRTTHSCRALYAQLQELESGQWYLHEDYGRLLLEHSTWASHHRVEKVALEDLGMQAPGLAQLKVIPR